MNVNLTPQLEEMVQRKMASGLYTSASEVVREALLLMDEQDRVRAAKLEQTRQDIRDGLDSGEPTPWDPDEIKGEGRKRRSARVTKLKPVYEASLQAGTSSFTSKSPRASRSSAYFTVRAT